MLRAISQVELKYPGVHTVLPVPRLRGRLGQVRCRKASWGCFGGRSFQNGGRKHESLDSFSFFSTDWRENSPL